MTAQEDTVAQPAPRICEGPECETEFEPANAQQKHCSPNCRKRAYEWREAQRVSEHVARQLLDPDAIRDAVLDYYEQKRSS